VRKVGLVVLFFLGVFAIIAGGADDSPGLQGLGLILILFLLFKAFRSRVSK
jgi:hypothetical protein